jgi:hypothetical protein
MNVKNTVVFLAAFGFLFGAGFIYAAADGHDHDHGGHQHEGHDMQEGMMQDDHSSMGHGMSGMSGMFLQKRHIDGYDVSFHVMAAQKGMEHGGSHNFMIKVEKGGKALGDVMINSKVVHPSGKAESKALMKMGDWYMNGYDLGAEGKYQLMILFKTADGKKHKGGVYYPGK